MAVASLIASTGMPSPPRAGSEIEAIEDEMDRWGVILFERLRMYEKLRGETAFDVAKVSPPDLALRRIRRQAHRGPRAVAASAGCHHGRR